MFTIVVAAADGYADGERKAKKTRQFHIHTIRPRSDFGLLGVQVAVCDFESHYSKSSGNCNFDAFSIPDRSIAVFDIVKNPLI